MSDELHELVGAYAIGALEEAEAAEFETHLETCVDCQNELFGMSDAVVGLDDLEYEVQGLTELAPVSPAPDLAPVHDLDSRRTGRWLAAAAAVAGLAFGLWASGIFDEDRVEIIATATDTEVITLDGELGTVDVLLSNTQGGVALDNATLAALEDPELYVLWVIRHDADAPEFVGNITDWSDVDKAWDIAVENVDIVAISIEQAPSPTTPSDQVVYVGERTRD